MKKLKFILEFMLPLACLAVPVTPWTNPLVKPSGGWKAWCSTGKWQYAWVSEKAGEAWRTPEADMPGFVPRSRGRGEYRPPVSTVVFEKGHGLEFGGVGFQNAEAEIAVLMPDDFRDQRVLKSFREISPTFSRVYAGFADCPKEQADRFADYYDATFRRAGTELYAVGGMMPFVPEGETEVYAEKVAANLEYLVKVRGCRNIRHYCMTNELGIDGRGDWYFNRMERFRQIHAALRAAFGGVNTSLIFSRI